MLDTNPRLSPMFARLGAAALLLALTGRASAMPLGTTLNDFVLPGTQPSTLTDLLSTTASCGGCHGGYGAPYVEPLRTWQGSMVAQAGRDPLFYAAMDIANQDAPSSGEMCIRCHMPKGWLEGRSVPTDASATTAADREGVQCAFCHRMVDPDGGPGAPAEDGAILAALTEPVVTAGGGQFVMDPDDRLRGPFDVIADLGYDPHAPARETLVSPFHGESRLCGTCHDVLNPAFQRNMLGEYEVSAMDAPGDPALAFPEQHTYSEWENSTYASTGVAAPQFAYGGNAPVGGETVSSCQDCHMPKTTGRAAGFGTLREDQPVHSLMGANTLVPSMIAIHPVYAGEVNAGALVEGADRALAMLRRAATVEATLDAGTLSVRVTNESGHKLPTGYPEGRRMWLHVRAFDKDDAVVFESGHYDTATSELEGYEAEPMDPDYDPALHVWECEQTFDATVAAASGLAAGTKFHLALNNLRAFDNRIPPRGFDNATFASIDAQPVGQAYADGQHWDDVDYTVGAAAVRAEVTLYYQTATREYLEFLRDTDVTSGAGTLAHDLWEDVGKGPPVAMAQTVVHADAKVAAGCRKALDKAQTKYLKGLLKAWSSCYADEASDASCDESAAGLAAAEAEAALHDRIGGAADKACAAKGLVPASIGLPGYCPAPCADVLLFDMGDLADCSACLAETVAAAALDSAYGVTPPDAAAMVAPGDAAACQKNLALASTKLATSWASALMRCEKDNSTGKNSPAEDCSTDPSGKITKARDSAAARVDKCATLAGLSGCADGAVDNAAAYACIDAAISEAVQSFPSAAYP